MDKIDVTYIQWTALAIMTAALLVRLTLDAIEFRSVAANLNSHQRTTYLGKRASALTIMCLFTIAVALSIAPLYMLVDSRMGGFNLANLVLRFLLFFGAFLLGKQVLASYRQTEEHEPRVARFIDGTPGKIMLGIASIVIITLFVLKGETTTSAGLLRYTGIDAAHFYAIVGYLYPAAVGALVIGMAYNMWIKRIRGLSSSAAILFFGLVLFIPLPILQATKSTFTAVAYTQLLMQYLALVLITTSLCMASVFRRRKSTTARSKLTQT